MTTDAFEQWPWSEGPAYAWGIGDRSGGDLVVGGHESVTTRGCVVAFGARDQFRISRLGKALSP
jgi:hypothetical protein